jgi:DNA-binding protein HU-beta
MDGLGTIVHGPANPLRARSRRQEITTSRSKSMNKSELVQALADKTDTTKADAQRTIDALFGTKDGVLTSALKRGDRVQITGFGTFETRQRKARTGRNPRTGEEIKIGPTISPSFRPGKALKDAVKR